MYWINSRVFFMFFFFFFWRNFCKNVSKRGRTCGAVNILNYHPTHWTHRRIQVGALQAHTPSYRSKLPIWSFDRKTYTRSSPKSSHSWNPWNPADFRWNPPKPYKIRRVFAETSDFIRFGVDFTWNPPDFMKSARFHVKSKDLLQGIVTLCLVFRLNDLSWWHA